MNLHINRSTQQFLLWFGPSNSPYGHNCLCTYHMAEKSIGLPVT